MRLLIVNFHYFREETYPSGIYPVNRAALNRQVDELAKQYTFISQNELAQAITTKNYPDKDFCLITIDDGLKEQMAAFEFLKEKGIPSILYVPTDAIQNHRVLNVHKLHYVRTQMTDEDLFGLLDEKYNIARVAFDMEALANQYRYDNETARKVKYFLNFVLTEDQKEEATNFFFSRLVSDETTFANQLYMNESDLKTLANAGVLGSHGCAHIPLATKPFEVAKADVQQSLNYLETITGTPVLSFSYPYGGKDAVNTNLAPAFENTNIKFALTMWRGVNTIENFNNPLFLHRVDTNDAPGGKNYKI
jgi:peptidoglycan/xylan/chitin deacetylase (PgdA/CDA1 family)